MQQNSKSSVIRVAFDYLNPTASVACKSIEFTVALLIGFVRDGAPLSTQHVHSVKRNRPGTQTLPKLKSSLCIIALGLGLSGVFNNAWAVCNGDTVISTNQTATQQNISPTWLCSFTVNGDVSITGGSSEGIANYSTITTLNNNGTISGDYGIKNNGMITTLNNSSMISGQYGIYNLTTIATLNNNNSGTISGGFGIVNDFMGLITELNNSGTISSTTSGAGIANYGTIIELNNNFRILGDFEGIRSYGPIGTLNNSSMISGQYGIYNGGTITTLNNSGTISGTSGDGIYNDGGTISELNNSGTISGNPTGFYASRGIINYGTIITLNNAQGAGNASGALTYKFALPTNYNIIITSSSTYGQLAATSVSGTMIFGISSLSTTSSAIVGQTLTGILQGFGSNLSTYITSGLTSSNGYTYSFAQQGSTGIWDLTITACSICTSDSSGSSGGTTISNITAGTSVGLNAFGVTANPVLAGGTLVLSGGDSSSVSIAITSAGGTIQAPTSGSAILSGVFSGSGGLTFTDTGTTVFTGANTYTGGTTVSGGTLSVAGTSPTGTGDVFVASAGTLMGTGTIAGNSTVSGVLKPGNSPGYLSFTQNLTLNSGSTYQQDIAGSVQANSATPVGASGYYSFVTVGSQLVINSGATLTPRLSNLFSANEPGYGSVIYIPALGDRFRMITATGGISGRFSTLTQPAELASGTQFIAFYNVNNSNSLDLAVTPTSYSSTLSSSTTNAREVANVLDQILGVNKTGNATAAQDSLLYSVAGQTAASLPGFAQALSGEVHAVSAATLPQATQRVQQAVLARLGDFPMPPTQLNGAGSNPLSSGVITGNNPSGLPTANMSSNPAVNPNAANITSAAITDGRAWGEIAYQRGERSGNSGGNGYNNNLYQAVFGVDAYTNAGLGLKLGGGLALSNTTVNATGGNSTIQQGALFVYGKMPVAQDYVLDGMVSLGLSSSKLSRSDITGISNGFSNKSVMGNDVLVSAGLSRPFETSDVRITPYVRLTYQYVGQAAYDEGASAAALSVGRMNANGIRAVLGVGAGSLNKDPLKDEYTYRANLAIGADSQGLLNPSLNTTLGGYSSSVTVPTAGTGFVQAGLYGTIKVADSAYAYAGVSAEARTGQTLYGGSVGLRVAF
ncbi:MAG: autotransporter outer membrane beta-barrel domain-containing protein [Burkholderiaceae bacterium]|nr:autotransporter outer membrane beta-barrel domain-containing protein [Burkholderiaceae bacterium]